MRLATLTFAAADSSTDVQYTETMVLKRGKDIVFAYKHVGTVTATMLLQVGTMIRANLDEAAYVQWKTTTYTFDTLPAGADCSDSETFFVGGYDCVRLKITSAGAGDGTIALSANIKD